MSMLQQTTPAGPRVIIVPAFTGQVALSKGKAVKLAGTLTNVGDEPGYFKVYGYLYSTSGPLGSSGYNQSGWNNLESYVTDNTKGVRFEGSWVQIQPNSSYTFSITSQAVVNWTGYARLWIVAAVSTSSSGSPRVYENEYYYFQDNIARITAIGPKSGLGNITVSQA